MQSLNRTSDSAAALRRSHPDPRLGKPVARREICRHHQVVAASVEWKQTPQGIEVRFACPGPAPHSWAVRRDGVNTLRSESADWLYFADAGYVPRQSTLRRPAVAPVSRRGPVVVGEAPDGSWFVRPAKHGEAPFPPQITAAQAAGLPHLLLESGCTFPGCPLKAYLSRVAPVAPLSNGAPATGRAGYSVCADTHLARYTLNAPNLVGQVDGKLVFRA